MNSFEKEEFFLKDSNNEKLSHQVIEISQTPIAFLTYNIILRPPLLKNNENDFKNERTKLFLKMINKYDIICLQEVFDLFNFRKQKIIKSAVKQGFYYYAEAPLPSFFQPGCVDAGLLTLSRFPIISIEFIPFNFCVLSDATARKGVLYTKIKIFGTFLHLFNTHTQATYVGSTSDIKATLLTRINQFNTLRKCVEKCLNKYKYKNSEMVLILGDLNVNARDPYFYKEVIADLPGVEEIDHEKKFNEYDNLMKIITDNREDQIIDWVDLAFPLKLPPTIGESVFKDEKELPYEKVITHKDDLMTNQTLDYVLEFIPKQDNIFNVPKDDDKKLLQVDKNSIEIEKFNVDNPFFCILSDHYGISGNIIYE